MEDYERAPAEAYINLTDLAPYLIERLQINTIEILVSEAGTLATHVYHKAGHLITDPVRLEEVEGILANSILPTICLLQSGAHYYWLTPKVDSETREDGEDGDEEDDEDE